MKPLIFEIHQHDWQSHSDNRGHSWYGCLYKYLDGEKCDAQIHGPFINNTQGFRVIAKEDVLAYFSKDAQQKFLKGEEVMNQATMTTARSVEANLTDELGRCELCGTMPKEEDLTLIQVKGVPFLACLDCEGDADADA